MSQLVEKLAAEARQLSADERVALVEAILAQLPKSDPEWEAAWVRECEDRIAALDRGEMRTHDFDEVMAQAHAQLHRP
jgi:putative addiction module component (TIGR02574 family)